MASNDMSFPSGGGVASSPPPPLSSYTATLILLAVVAVSQGTHRYSVSSTLARREFSVVLSIPSITLVRHIFVSTTCIEAYLHG